jgi:beta-phosphoglucomutase
MPGAAALIADLHAAGFKLAIGSSGPPENVALVQQKIPHGDLILATVDGSQVKRGKPDPEVFLAAAGKLSVAPARSAVIEDAVVGIQAAKAAGMTAIALTGTAPRDELAKLADHVVDALTDLTPAIIRQLIDASPRL